MTSTTPQDSRVAKALSAESSSIRLQAALAIGSGADADYTELLVERCAIEPDFFVRDMLSWALTRLPSEIVLPRLHRELDSGCNQARSQALHTLSKIGDKSTWPWITREMLGDPDDGIARTAWRTAVVLVPEDEKASLAEELARQLGRGDRSVQLSLSRALIDLGEFADPVLEKAAQSFNPKVAAHARATELLRRDPERGFAEAIFEARLMLTPGASSAEESDTGVARAGTEGAEPVGGAGGDGVLIGDAARSSGVSARMLRHYEALGLVRPTGRTSAGYRDYSAEDVRRIFQVESLRSMGLSLKQVGRALEDPDLTPAALVVDLIRCTEERLAQERELLDRLRAIVASAPADWRDVLRVIDLMRDLDSESAARRQQAVLIRSAGAPVPVELLAEALLGESEPDVAGALRWAIARSGGDAVAALRAGARAGDTDVRRRAVRAISEVPEAPGAAVVLAQALDDPDAAVRDCAALALGRCGVTEAVPVLVAMVVEGAHDVEAAEVLGVLCRDDERASWIVNALTDELAAPTAETAVRLRLTQALIELPVDAAGEVLRRLVRDSDPAVARLASVFA